MDPSIGRDVREATCQHRVRPAELAQVRVAFESGGRLADDIPAGPVALTLEATDASGEPAPWLDDLWWTEVMQRWYDDPVVVRILPTAGSLLHPVILCQVEMLRRVVPRWRVVAHAYVDDVVTDEGITKVAAAAYHEVRFIDQRRPGRSGAERLGRSWPIDELFGRIRVAQSRMYRASPVLVRLPAQESQTNAREHDRPLDRSLVRDGAAGVPRA